MKYQDILKDHLLRRTTINPRYSLRAFARAVGLEPSKLSEVLSGKKGLSPDRAEKVSEKLRLEGTEKEVFLLSVAAQHSRFKKLREESSKRLKELLTSKGVAKEKTIRRNAWYFGAVQAVQATALKVERLVPSLQLTSLQIESAERFISRLKKLHPERSRMNYEPMSLLKKLNSDFSTGALKELDTEFIFLTEEQAQNLSILLLKKAKAFSSANRQSSKSHLYMYFVGFSKLCSKEELC